MSLFVRLHNQKVLDMICFVRASSASAAFCVVYVCVFTVEN